MFKKEAREIFKKMQKPRMNTFFRKERTPFLLTNRVQLKMKARKHFLFFQKKEERLIKRTHFFIWKGLKEHFLFGVFSFFTIKLKKRNKTADETCEN